MYLAHRSILAAAVLCCGSVSIEYSLASLIAHGLPSSSGPLVIEGRQPAVVARYVRDRLGKVTLHHITAQSCPASVYPVPFMAHGLSLAASCEQSECASVYVTCSVREQALRFIEREAGKQYAEEANASIPQRTFTSLSEVEPFVKQLVSDSHVHSAAQCSAPRDGNRLTCLCCVCAGAPSCRAAGSCVQCICRQRESGCG